ncbi:MAG: CoA pyrophosphatase [Bacteroidota bacterium]
MIIVFMDSVARIKELLSTRQRRQVVDEKLTRAAVLMALFKKKDAWHLLMTKRSDEVEHHKGQISFPGGAADSSDKNIVATALRETEEEIGLQAGQIEILGQYDDHVTPTGFIITPVVGYIKKLPGFSPKEEEVVEILEVPVSLFRDPTKERMVQLVRHGTKVDVYFYDFGKHEIWGATARISRDFLRETEIAKIPL